MIIIGMLHHRKNPEKVKKSYAYAAVAMAEGARLLYFSPKSVDFENRVINGYVYQDGKWNIVRSRFPDVIYNTGSPVKLSVSSDIIDRLKKEIPFTTYSIGNKMRVYQRLSNDGEFAKYLIPTHMVYSVKRFSKYLRMYRKIVFKPVNGHKGQGITFIESIRNDYTVELNGETRFFKLEELLKYVESKIEEEPYVIQPYINCKTKTGNSYDFRLHTQKDENGKWVITAIYPRIGPSGSIVSNINSGGATNYLLPFLKQEFGDEYYNIKRYLENFCLRLAQKMDDIQMLHFNERIDELGIDVGLDDLRKIWIYEVNWRPGCPPAFYLELDVVRNMIRYAMYLFKEKKEVEYINDRVW